MSDTPYVGQEEQKRPRRTFSVATFIMNEGRVLLIKHKLLGLWLPVGGEIEEMFQIDAGSAVARRVGETPQEAARREVKEETGLDVVFHRNTYALDGEPDGFLGYEEHEAGPKGVHMNFNFVALSESAQVTCDGSFTAHAWYPVVDGLDENQLDTTKSVIQCVRRISWMRRDGRLP